MKLIFRIIVIFLVGIGIFFRIWRLDKVPIELFGDEVDVGLQAYSILTTGKDYLGNKFPIMFRSFSEYRLPMQLYLDVPFIDIFGLNEIGVRMPSMLLGIVSIILFYFLVREAFNKKIAIIATLFLIFSPWHFNFSRQANDAGILFPFLISGVLCFIKGLKEYKYLIFSSILFTLTFYSYAIATVFTPLFAFSLIVIYRKRLFKYSLWRLTLVGVIGLLVLIPYIIFTVKGVSSQRFSSISAIPEDKLMQEVVDRRRWSNSLLTRALYNKRTIAAEIVAKNYVKAFSTNFLFTEGDPNMRQSIEGFGQMYHYDLILVLLGAWLFFGNFVRDKNKKGYFVILAWLILAPLPSALTKDGGYHASRLILMLPPLIFMSSLGFNFLIEETSSKKGKIIFGIFVLLMILDVTRFFHRYFVIWQNESWRFWQYGFKETVSYVKEVDADYKRIYFNNTYEPILGRFLFWYGYDMKLFQKEFKGDVHIENIVDGINGFKLGEKFYFGELDKPIERLANPETLVVASAEKDATNPQIFRETSLNLFKTVTSPTGEPIFYIFTGR
ncbi:hypothetical protein A2961_03500 [Candidatus Woesebacteria bacterium RIFCSPLOWO2_01_FULL_39_21]|uniref:Glycosyltransferase RgtA/B/C/D-like domain-containing protein n=1 Tax=Candidatus Woesebacteria bacterium RIFCSPLOWO2_01_FULL_39_21 TaxID=1802519 RepID=A0A1F8BGG1_9BACT|nr:MAG: hypothetical protein A2961_03500 [Candidatus Woesebacteria bacterium RIFCSPLOWO2_01_FULL_39_21]